MFLKQLLIVIILFDQEKLKKMSNLHPKLSIDAMLLDFEEQYNIKHRARDNISQLRKEFEEDFEKYLRVDKLLSVSTMTEVYYNFSKGEECVRLESHKFKENFEFIHSLITTALKQVENSFFAHRLFISIEHDTYIIRATFNLRDNMIDVVILANSKSQLSARDIARRAYGINFDDSAKELKGIIEWSKMMFKAYKHDMKRERKKIRETRKKIRRINWQEFKASFRSQWK